MTDTPTSPAPEAELAAPKSTNKRERLYKIGFAISLVALVLIAIFLRGNSAITKPFVEEQLKQIADNIAVQAALSGDEAQLTYGEVKVEGGFFRSNITILSPKLEYTAHLPFGNVQKTTVLTTKALISAEKISVNEIAATFPDPFTIERDGFSTVTMKFESAPEYVFSKQNKVERHALHLPPSLTMVSDAGSEKPVEISMSYAANPTLSRMIDRAENKSKSELAFRDIRLTSSEEKSQMNIAELLGSSAESSLGKNLKGFESQLTVGKLEIVRTSGTKGPYGFNLKLVGKYVMPEKFDDQFAGVNDMEITLNNLALTTPDFSVTLAGLFNQKPDDSMPFGKVDIGIKGLDKFRNSEFLPVADASLKNAVIGAVVGNDDVQLKDAFFTVRRDKNSSLFIGESSFENLVGLVITHGLSRQLQDEPTSNSKDEKPLPPTDIPDSTPSTTNLSE